MNSGREPKDVVDLIVVTLTFTGLVLIAKLVVELV